MTWTIAKLKALQKAIRRDAYFPPGRRQQLVDEMFAVFQSPDSSDTLKTAAVAVFIEMDAANIRAEEKLTKEMRASPRTNKKPNPAWNQY